MTPIECPETRDEVMAVGREFGQEIGKDQLYEWKRAGLIEAPWQGSGRGRGRGRPTCYPRGTAERCRYILKWGEWDRRLPLRAWAIWTDPEAPDLPKGVLADALEEAVDRAIGLDLWERVAASEEGLEERRIVRAVRRTVARLSGERIDSTLVEEMTQALVTLARDPEIPELPDLPNHAEATDEDKTEADRRYGEAAEERRLAMSVQSYQRASFLLRAVLEPLLPGWQSLVEGPAHQGVETFSVWNLENVGPGASEFLPTFAELVLRLRDMFDPSFLHEWIRATDESALMEYRGDLWMAHERLFPAERALGEPPSLALFYVVIMVRRSRLTQRGIRDALWNRSDAHRSEDLRPVRTLIREFPLKKTDRRRRRTR